MTPEDIPGHPAAPESKARLRMAMRTRLASLDPAERAGMSASLASRIESLADWRSARTVLLYSPRADEPDLGRLLASALEGGRRLGLPAYDPASGSYGCREVRDLVRDLVNGRYGIPEPAPDLPWISLDRLDFTAVPGLAFDHSGGRLGRGRGFYDRLLAGIRGLTCGVGFDFQVLSGIPVEAHDVKLNMVMTPTHVYVCRGVY